MRIAELAGQQQAQVLLPGEHLPGVVIGVGGDDDLGENLGNRLGGRSVERAVERDDPAEGRDAVALERGTIGVDQCVAAGDAARIGVLDDDDARPRVAEF